MSEGTDITFDPASYDQGAARMHQAGGDLELAGDGYEAVQGRASGQLRQWAPAIPAADIFDQVEARLGQATRLGGADLRQTGGKLLTARANLEEADARSAAAASQAEQQLGQVDFGSGTASGGGLGSGNRIDQILNGDLAAHAAPGSASRVDGLLNGDAAASGAMPAEPSAGQVSSGQRAVAEEMALDRKVAILNEIRNTTINPKFDRLKTAYKENCSSVVVAYEMRRRGFPVQASALESAYRSDEGGDGGRPLSDIEQAWGTTFTLGDKAAIEAAFSEPGSRGIVAIMRRTGHVINVENIGGEVRFIDAQQNPPITEASSYFSGSAWSAYLRTDNLPDPALEAISPFVEPGGNAGG